MIPVNTAIKEIRRQRGMSQGQIAERSGLLRNNVSRYESGARGMSVFALERFAKAFGVPAWRILRYAEKIGEKA